MQPKSNKFSMLIMLIIMIILLGATGVFVYKNYLRKKIDEDQLSTLLTDSVENWKTYISQDNFLTFEYPKKLDKLISSKQFRLSIKSKQETINMYEKFKKKGCPLSCGAFVNDPDLLLKQFDILNKVSESPNCVLSEIDKKEIKDNFILFTGAIGNKHQIEGIKNKNGQCGLQIIESDGFDASLINIYYKVVFLIDDKVVFLKFNIFPINVFEEVDNLWSSIGFDSTSNVCNIACVEKGSEYFQKFNVNNAVEKQVIKNYNQIISTLQFKN